MTSSGGQAAPGQVAPRANWSDGIAKWISAGVAITGVVFGGVQFLEAKSVWRMERTTPYFERYESGEIGAARRQVATSLKAYRQQFDEIERAGVTAADRDAMLISIFTSDLAIGDGIDMIVDFFQGMRVCVDAELCDRDVTMRYFASSDADDLWLLAAPYIRYRRENNHDYADAFESFLTPGTANQAASAKPSAVPKSADIPPLAVAPPVLSKSAEAEPVATELAKAKPAPAKTADQKAVAPGDPPASRRGVTLPTVSSSGPTVSNGKN